MSRFSVVFCGTPSFACPSLQALHDDDAYDVRLVISQPDRPVGRKNTLTPSPVKTLANALGIPVWQPEKLNKEFDQIPVRSFDLLVVVAYGQIVSQTVLDSASIAPVNVHASLLPRWRGASPMQWGILAGDALGGVTVQRMVRELDAGPILAQAPYAMDDSVTIGRMHDDLAIIGASLLVKTLREPLKETPQDESHVTVCGKLSRADGIADPHTMTAIEIDRKVRALVPWPGVTCSVMDEEVKLLKTALRQSDDVIAIPCAEETVLFVERLQSKNRNPLSAKEWLKGKRQVTP